MKIIFKSKALKITLVALICVSFFVGISALAVSSYVVSSTQERIISESEALELDGVDCILILGCLVKSDGTPSDMLADRLKRGVTLYKNGVAPKLLMSGDHGQIEYDEVSAMKKYAVESGIASSDVFMDHAGFSTYESLYRAKEIFDADKIVIVTQEYHLPRALYIANALGIEAYGVASDYRTYSGQTVRDIREILARNKDFLTSVFKPQPTYLGDKIDISGDGDVTN